MTDSTVDAQVVVDTALAAAEPNVVDVGQVYSVVVPHGAHHEVIDLEAKLDQPRRKRGVATLFTADSFSRYVQTHDSDRVWIYGDVEAAQLVAVLNGDTSDDAGWGDHRAVLRLRHTQAWKRWIGADGRIGSQQQFAEHIENGLEEIIEPPGADLLELAQHFQATVKVNFKSAKILANGERQLVYEETIDAKAGQKGEFSIPPSFTVALQPFEGSDTYKVVARLRTRLADEHLHIGYQLDRPDKVLQAAFDDILKQVEESTSHVPLLGTPPEAR